VNQQRAEKIYELRQSDPEFWADVEDDEIGITRSRFHYWTTPLKRWYKFRGFAKRYLGIEFTPKWERRCIKVLQALIETDN
jgi:hypothetical protein